MKVILVPDIFGDGVHLSRLIEHLKSNGFSVTIVSPYKSLFSFKSEEEAYQCYLTESGHDDYYRKLLNVIEQETEAFVLLGFSAGASAAWRAVSNLQHQNLKGFLGFYPGQIRNYLDLSPKSDTRLVFPKQEKHFDVNKVISSLSNKQKVVCEMTPFEHGFMNENSPGFNEEGAKLYADKISEYVIKLS